MASTFRAIIANIISMSGFAAPVAAGPFEDSAEALKWYRTAAEQGNADAQFYLGLMYDKGQGVTQNYAEAVKWFRRAADQDDADAQNNLGIMYANGHGVPQVFVRAHMWYNLAVANGEKVAKQNREEIARFMTPAQIAEAQKLARDWKPTRVPPATR